MTRILAPHTSQQTPDPLESLSIIGPYWDMHLAKMLSCWAGGGKGAVIGGQEKEQGEIRKKDREEARERKN